MKDYKSRKFLIFCVVFTLFTVLLFLEKISQGNYVILADEALIFYVGGNGWDSHIKAKNGGS